MLFRIFPGVGTAGKRCFRAWRGSPEAAFGALRPLASLGASQLLLQCRELSCVGLACPESKRESPMGGSEASLTSRDVYTDALTKTTACRAA